MNVMYIALNKVYLVIIYYFKKKTNTCISGRTYNIFYFIFTTNTTSTTFGLLYKALVRPHLEYANVIWFPGLKRQSVAIEKVQRRATKLLSECKSMSYKERLSYLGLHSLYGRRVRGDLIQVYKIYKGLDDIKWSDFFVSPFCTNTRNSEGKIFINHCFTNKRKFSFSNRVAKHWNELPPTLKNSRNINEFKNQLDIHPKFKDLLYSFDQ